MRNLHRNFKSLLELREFLVRLVSESKTHKLPDMSHFKESIFRQIKEQGYTKTFSKKARAFISNKIFVGMEEDKTLFTVSYMLSDKKGYSVVAVCLKRITIEDNHYYIGSNPENPRCLVISPHLFSQYKYRTGKPTPDAAILGFMESALLTDFAYIKIPGSRTGEILIKIKEGIALGHVTNLGLQNKEVVFLKTFINNRMLSSYQKELLGEREERKIEEGEKDIQDSDAINVQ